MNIVVVSKRETTTMSKLVIAKNATTTPEGTKKDTSGTEKDTSDNDTLKQILQHVTSIDAKLK